MFKTTKSVGQNDEMIILIEQFYTQFLLMCCSTHKAQVGRRSKQKCKMCISSVGTWKLVIAQTAGTTSESAGCRTLQEEYEINSTYLCWGTERLLPQRGTKWIIRHFSAWDAEVARSSSSFHKSLAISSLNTERDPFWYWIQFRRNVLKRVKTWGYESDSPTWNKNFRSC